MKRNKIRITAAIFAMLMIVIILISAYAVILEATHDCDGAGCEVCTILGTILLITRTMTAAAFLLIISCVIKISRQASRHRQMAFADRTPVSEKVRLLN